MKKKFFILVIALLGFNMYAIEWEVCGHKFYAPGLADYVGAGYSNAQAWMYFFEDVEYYTEEYCSDAEIFDEPVDEPEED